MRCPQCSEECVDLRDICPKCLSDLRQHKIELGLTVLYPNLSYRELVKVSKGSASPHAIGLATIEHGSAAAQGHPSDSGDGIGEQLVAGVTGGTQVVECDVDLRNSPDRHKVQQLLTPSSSSEKPKPRIFRGEYDWGESAKIQTSEKSELFTQGGNKDQRSQDKSVSQGLRGAHESAQLPSALEPDSLRQQSVSEKEAALEADARVQDSLISNLGVSANIDIVSPPSTSNDSEVSQLFIWAESDLLAMPATGWEWNLARDLLTADPQELALLFEAVEASLLVGKNIFQDLQDVQFSAHRQVAATKLVEQVEKISQSIDKQLQQPTKLSDVRIAHETGADQGQEEELFIYKQRIRPAASVRRFAAASIDLFVTMALAGLVALSLVINRGLIQREDLLSGDFWELGLFWVGFGWRLTISSLGILLIYTLLATVFSRRTLGMALCSLKVSCINGRHPQFSHLLVRVMMLPVSLLFLGWCPGIWGQRGLHDRFAQTILTREEL